MKLVISFVLICIYIVQAADELYSCGGFVKGQNIDFAKVKVNLYGSDSTSLKFSTDCAPNNGYYMIPVYSKGSFVLRVQPPDGWIIEPKEVSIEIDGKHDACHLAKDINFQFVGFSVSGKVVSKGSADGPANVPVTLLSADGSGKPMMTRTAEKGLYNFSPVPVGKYKLQLQDNICMKSGAASVDVVSDAVHVKTNIEISGYSLSARIFEGDIGVSGAEFVLLSKSVSQQNVPNCKIDPTSHAVQNAQKLADSAYHPLCVEKSNKDGEVKFSCVPTSSDYLIIPYYQSAKTSPGAIEFDISPLKMAVVVEHKDVVVKEAFKITGFSLSGFARWSAQDGNSKPLSDVDILLDGVVVTKSDAAGRFTLRQLRSDKKYKLSAALKGIEFPAHEHLHITSTRPSLPVIAPKAVEVCGDVKLHQDSSHQQVRRIMISPAGPKQNNDAAFTVTADATGHFCSMLPVGEYVVEPQLHPSEKSAHMKLLPQRATVDTRKDFVAPLSFSQFTARVSGKVKCFGECPSDVRVSLSDSATTPISIDSSGSFGFENVGPGAYSVKIESASVCWKEDTLKLTVVDKDMLNSLEFTQSGYAAHVSTTHETKINYASTNKQSPDAKSDIQLAKGSNLLCLRQKARYKITVIDNCHRFSPAADALLIDLSSGRQTAPLALIATQHRITGSIRLPSPSSSVTLRVEPAQGAAFDLTHGPTSSNTYQFDFYTDTHSHVLLRPMMKDGAPAERPTFLFSPEKKAVDVADNCILGAFEFTAVKSQYLQGTINPALPGVSIHVASSLEKHKEWRATGETDKAGRYEIGPLRSLDDLVITPKQVGYVFTEVEGKMGHFTALKLSELVIKTLSSNNEPLSGVLVSLSGGAHNFRSNNKTGDSGALVFIGLSPGQYFVRAIYKEFDFEPPSQMVDVSEGETVKVELVAKRVAFSCLGRVRTLNGQPVENAVVEAAASQQCGGVHEEASTGADGAFRVRGLKPSCPYTLRLRSTPNSPPTAVVPTAPETYSVTVTDADVTQRDIILLPELTNMEAMGRVVLGEIGMLSKLKVELFRDDIHSSDVAISSQPLSSPLFFLPPLALDNKTYVVRLATSPGFDTSKYETPLDLPSAYFTANQSFVHLQLPFAPTIRKVEAELSTSSYFAFLLLTALALLSYYHETTVPIALEIGMWLRDAFGRSLRGGQQFVSDAQGHNDSDVDFVDTPIGRFMQQGGARRRQGQTHFRKK